LSKEDIEDCQFKKQNDTKREKIKKEKAFKLG
jgi:hypothetical protein